VAEMSRQDTLIPDLGPRFNVAPRHRPSCRCAMAWVFARDGFAPHPIIGGQVPARRIQHQVPQAKRVSPSCSCIAMMVLDGRFLLAVRRFAGADSKSGNGSAA
jgi:hypothetical protein